MRPLLTDSRRSFLFHPDPPPGGAGGDKGDSPPRSAADMQKDLDAAIAARDSAKTELRSQREQLDALTKQINDRDAADAKAKEEAEKAEKLKQGKYEEVLAKAKSDFEKQLGDANEKFGRVFREQVVQSQLRVAAAGVKNIVPAAVDEIAALLASRIKVDPATYGITVIDAAGNPAVDKELKPLSIAGLVSEFVAARPYYLLSPASSSPGGHPGDDGKDFGDIKRAMRDPEYMENWRKADAKGLERAADKFFAGAPAGGVNVMEQAK